MLLAFGTLWFWFFLSVGSLLLVLFLENESYGWSSLITIAFFVSLGLFGNFNLIMFLWHNPLLTGIIVLSYALIGGIWSLLKWYIFLKKRISAYNKIRASFLTSIGVDPKGQIPEEEKQNFLYALQNDAISPSRPKASKNKTTITSWVAYWPWSVISTVLGDLLLNFFKKLGHLVYDSFHDLYESISKRVYKNVENDFPDTLKSKKNL